MTEARRILMMMSGSIACAKATALISAWRKAGHRVRVAVTPSVRHFVGAGTLEGLSGAPVFADTFTDGRIMDHVDLARWADQVVVCPATSNLLNKLAAGIADDVVSTLWQAAWGRGVPMFVVPAMNTQMWRYPATQDAVKRLQSWGVHVLPVGSGALACGDQGEGRLLEPDAIMTTMERLWTPALDGQGCRVLVTAGGTREPIDAVRHIGNRSSGSTAARMADTLAGMGHAVTWLGAASAIRPEKSLQMETFETFSDLDQSLQRLLGEQHYDLVVHAAAVSDFRVDNDASGQGKLDSANALTLRLVPNPKLLHGLKAHSLNPDLKVVGFKLTVGANRDAAAGAVARQFARGAVDAVVHNDLELMQPGRHPMWLFLPGQAPVEYEGPAAMAIALGEAFLARQVLRSPGPAIEPEVERS